MVLDNNTHTLKLKSGRARHAATPGHLEVIRSILQAVRRPRARRLRRRRSPRCSRVRPHRRRGDGRPREADQLDRRHRRRQLPRQRSARSSGNVVITQGTMTIHADRITFRQNPDNSMSATAWGNPVTLPAEARRLRRIFRGLRPARRVRRNEAAARALRPRAAAPQPGRDPQQLHFVQHGDREFAKAEGRRGVVAAAESGGAGARVRGVFQPKSDTPLRPKGKDAPRPPDKGRAAPPPAAVAAAAGRAQVRDRSHAARRSDRRRAART